MSNNLSQYRVKYFSELLRWIPPQTPGKVRLAKRLLGAGLQSRDVKIRGRRGVDFIAPSLQEPVGFYLLVNGVYEGEVLDYILSLLSPGDTFIDVGANIGSIALPVARRLGQNSRVIAIESSPKIFPYLKQNMELNRLGNTVLFQCAATNTNFLETLFYEAPIEKFGMGSLGAQFHNHPIPVMTRTLDSILEEEDIDHVSVIKIDVEGFEASVLQGAEKTLTGPTPPTIVFEFCDWAEERAPDGLIGDAQRLLKNWGYDIWRIKDKMRGAPPLRDVLTVGYDMLIAMKAS
jgi:FkbM family methyltransferase